MAKVVIDGVRYVPVVELLGDSVADVMLQVLYESYMGTGKHWSEDYDELWVNVNEDSEGISFAEFAAEILLKAKDN